MEHRLITGGAEYLPFARSCVVKLKKLGLPYADQSHVIEGVTIRVRIEPGHEYIHIEGGGASIEMDSGVVDLGNIGYLGAERFDPGKLYATDYYKSYTNGFTSRTGDWIKNPGKGSKGQVAGKITVSNSIKGKIRPDEYIAASFTPKRVVAVPPTTELSKDDEWLFLKKIITTYCPASMFTGKCRLWVQAIYGRPLYIGEDTPLKHITIGGVIGRPWLVIDGAVKDKESGSYPVIGITTNCGVYLDKSTGNHWFIDISERQGTAMPLKASAAVESMRRKLKDHYAGASELTEQDAEHLEAFILSDCRPDPFKQQVFTFTPTKSVWSLGYGWHWNWSGTAADFVCNDLFEQEYIPGTGNNYAIRSTHYRLELSAVKTTSETGSVTTSFSATSSIVSGPSDWTMVPSQWCILEPNWSGGSATKLQPPYTRMMTGAATFYAYYDRDTLRTCRVEVTATDSQDDFVDFTDLWTGPGNYGGPEYGMTEGMRGGSYTARSSVYGTYFTAKFNCSEVSSGDLIYNRVYIEQNYSISNKVQGAVPPGVRFDYGGLWAPGYVQYGYSPWQQQYYPAMVGDVGYPPVVTFDYKSHQKQVSFYSYAHIMTPFCDAEAILVRTECHKYTVYSQCFKTVLASSFMSPQIPKIFVPGYTVGAPNVDWVWTGERGYFERYDRYAVGEAMHTIVTPKQPDTIENTDEALASVATMAAAGANVTIVMDDRSEYGNIMLDDVQVHYEVRSGVQEGSNAVVIAPALEAQTGVSHEFYSPTVTDIHNPTIVGWA